MAQDKTTLISNILDEGNLSKLIGLKEDLWFEIKGKNPYDFNSPDDRYELAKDVTALANAEGGYLIIGLEHDRS